MDEFAQTRGSEDLFDDDFTPAPEPSLEPKSATPIDTAASQPPPHKQTAPPFQSPQLHNPADASQDATATSNTSPHPSSSSGAAASTLINDPSSTQQDPAPQPRPHTPVRGDRRLTGGLAKPKLTEEELSAKLAAAKLNSAKRAEAHRLAEADEADFHAREAKVHLRRQEEGRARRVMDMERERNRIRKLGSKGGREWDEGKEEAQAQQQGRGRGYRRGVNGGIAGGRGGVGGPNGLYMDGLPDQERGEERRGQFEPRGRARGRGRGVGVDRGGAFHMPVSQTKEQKALDPVQDFPALPQKPKVASEKAPDSSITSPRVATESSWADQVNSEAQKTDDARKR